MELVSLRTCQTGQNLILVVLSLKLSPSLCLAKFLCTTSEMHLQRILECGNQDEKLSAGVEPTSQQCCIAPVFGMPKTNCCSKFNLASPSSRESPATTSLMRPLPAQSSARTATTEASLATPTVRPAAVEATCVPWPSQSAASPSSAPLAKLCLSLLPCHQSYYTGRHSLAGQCNVVQKGIKVLSYQLAVLIAAWHRLCLRTESCAWVILTTVVNMRQYNNREPRQLWSM